MDAGSKKLNVIFSSDCIKYPLTGIGRYAFELAKQLQQRQDLLSLTYLHGMKIRHSLAVASESAQSIQSLKRKLQQSTLISDLYRMTFPVAKSLILTGYKNHIYHSPNYYLPPYVRHGIATFHDLSVFHWPQFHPPGRVHLMQKELRKTVKRATMLISDSQYTKNELMDYFDLDEKKIAVAPLACNEQFHPRSETEVQAILQEYKLQWRRFFLYTGTIEPRKNIVTLLQAFDRLPLSEKKHHPLVISGYKGWENQELFRLFRKGENEGWLKYLGYVPAKNLPALYSAANSFVFPSIYEGFGLPVLEAMASGTPVICSNSTSLPEVVGHVALQHAPLDVDMLTIHLRTMIEDQAQKQAMVQAGLDRSKHFSWTQCADKTIQAYIQVSKFI